MITELMQKPKKSVWPITGDTNNPMNQSEIQKKKTHVAGAKRGNIRMIKLQPLLVLLLIGW